MIGPILAASLALAQASAQPAAGASSTTTPAPMVVKSRLATCIDQAQKEPDAAIVSATNWLQEVSGPAQSPPRQCMGFAYISQLRWGRAEIAFLAAHAALPDTHTDARARLAAMAGNAALADDNLGFALRDFELAHADAAKSDNPQLAGEIATDRARALVGLDRLEEAANVLGEARDDAPQYAPAWLLSATLARRMEAFEQAREWIGTAAALAPEDPAVALEAGLIAALTGQDELARKNWHSVMAISPQSSEAKSALFYLMQLDTPEDTP